MTVGRFKAGFSEVLQEVKSGKKVGIRFGKKGHLVAVIAPASHFLKETSLRLGLLEKKGSFKLRGDFKMTDEDLLGE